MSQEEEFLDIMRTGRKDQVVSLYASDVATKLQLDSFEVILKHDILKIACTAVHEGVNREMYYAAVRGSCFCIHVEDSQLLSVSWSHAGGSPRVWWAVRPEQRKRVEELFGTAETGRNLLASKSTFILPEHMLANGIDVVKVIQAPETIV